MRPIVTGLAAVFASLAISACGAAGGSPAAPKAHTGSTQDSVSAAALDFMVPTDGAQVVVGVAGISDFIAQIATKATDACLKADGFPPVSPLPLLSGTVSTQLPNLSYIRSHHNTGVQYFPSTDPTRNMGQAEKRAYNSAVKRCTFNPPPLAVMSAAANSIMTQWANFTSQTIDTNAAVRAANKAGAKCSRQTPFPASTYEAELAKVGDVSYADAKHGNRAPAFRVAARGAAVFLKCFGPAVEAVDEALAAGSKSFLARNAQAIRLIQRRTAAQIAAISAKYDVPFGKATKREGR